MSDEMEEQIRFLERAVVEIAEASKRTHGFVAAREYKGIPFEVSQRFVIADLSPLAFFHLVEHIEEGDADAAINRLHDRLFPLLSCRHEWTALKRASDEHRRKLSNYGLDNNSGPYVCRLCTAYALGGELPSIGRGNEQL